MQFLSKKMQKFVRFTVPWFRKNLNNDNKFQILEKNSFVIKNVKIRAVKMLKTFILSLKIVQ